jgi:CRP/FNR family cyclic AMP-dependent transcriptional regulator
MPDPAEILAELVDHPQTRVAEGEVIIEQGQRSGVLFFLVEGEIEVLKDEVTINRESAPGSAYGEISILLDTPHMAQVKAASDSLIVKVDDPEHYLLSHPKVLLHLCRVQATRLASATHFMVDIKRQYAGKNDHVSMVDGILNNLIHRNPQPVEGKRIVREDH